MKEKVLVCAAWPYANGPLHLGHIAGSLLPPDIFARYMRMSGREVLMVSGSDEHGTPITVHAQQLGVSPEEVVNYYHKLNSSSIEGLGIKFSLFFETHHENHRKFVQQLFLKLLEKGHIYPKKMHSPYCPKCQQFLPDRYVEGTCPYCGYEEARGDQCDNCGKTLDPEELVNPRCKFCGTEPEMRETEHFFLRLSAFQDKIEEYVEAHKDIWKKNTYNYTIRWLRESLKDRPITRDLSWGVEIPVEGYEDKRIYVWFEAVIGYLSCSMEYSRRTGKPDYWKEFWLDPNVKSYYFLGKDNVPFHTIIWPAILMAYDENLNLPYDVPAMEYLMLSGSQFSKSRRHAVWVHSYLKRYDPDALRFYLAMHMPELHDTDFRWDMFVDVNNNILSATIGNFIHRALTFTYKNYNGRVPEYNDAKANDIDRQLLKDIEEHTALIGEKIEAREFKEAVKAYHKLAQIANRYFTDREPWKVVKQDKEEGAVIMHNALRMVKALAVAGSPFIPFAAQKTWEMLGFPGRVEDQPWSSAMEDIPAGQEIKKPEALFRKLDLNEVMAAEKEAAEEGVVDEFLEHLKSTGKEESDKTEEGLIDIEYLGKVDLVVGEIKEVEAHPNADKLLVLKVDIGDEVRQLVAGLKKWYSPEDLKGRKIIMVKNLKPAKLRGVESQGMLLAAEDKDGNVSLLTVDRDISPGSGIR